MTRTEQIPERQVVEGAVLAMVMTMTKPRVRRIDGVARKRPGKGRE